MFNFLKKKKEFSVSEECYKRIKERRKNIEHDINYAVKNGGMSEEMALEIWNMSNIEAEKVLDEIFSRTDLEVDRMRENPCEKPHNNCEDGDKKGIDNCSECQIIEKGI